jgi:hypothetical protein
MDDADFGSERASATAIAATCSPVISPGISLEADSCAGVVDDAEDATLAAGAGDASLSSKLMPLIDRAKIASTAKTTPMPTRLSVSPSFSKS